MQGRLIESRNKFSSVQIEARERYDEGKEYLDRADMLLAQVHAAREDAWDADQGIQDTIKKAAHLIGQIEEHLGQVMGLITSIIFWKPLL